jgi:hypothetical protein
MLMEGIADPKRVAIFGSHGGYATFAGVTFTLTFMRRHDYVGVANCSPSCSCRIETVSSQPRDGRRSERTRNYLPLVPQ